MKLNVTQTLCGPDGAPLMSLESGAPVPITLRDACGSVLGMTTPQDNPDFVAKVRRMKLAQRVFATDEVELSVEDIVLLKSLMGQHLVTFVCAAACMIIDPEA